MHYFAQIALIKSKKRISEKKMRFDCANAAAHHAAQGFTALLVFGATAAKQNQTPQARMPLQNPQWQWYLDSLSQ